MNSDNKIPRKIPVLIIYLHPFRIIESKESGKWESNIEEINDRKWNYIKLHEIVGGLDVGLKPPYHLVIGFDGALSLPPIPELMEPQKAVEFYNKCLAALLLGGIYCEAVNLDSLETGAILDWKYIRAIKKGKSAASHFHNLIRLKMAPPIEAISLLNPKTIQYKDLYIAMEEGMEIINRVPNINAEFLLKGVSGLARMDWGTAISNLWIIVEQMINYLWNEHIVKLIPTDVNKIDGQKEQLSDHRTWSTANRIELLYQKQIISNSIIRNLSLARKSRNKLVHDGKHPDKEASYHAYTAIVDIIELIAGRKIPLSKLNLKDHSLSDPFQVSKKGPIRNVQYWMPYPKLPGEEEIDREEIEATYKKKSRKLKKKNK